MADVLHKYPLVEWRSEGRTRVLTRTFSRCKCKQWQFAANVWESKHSLSPVHLCLIRNTEVRQGRTYPCPYTTQAVTHHFVYDKSSYPSLRLWRKQLPITTFMTKAVTHHYVYDETRYPSLRLWRKQLPITTFMTKAVTHHYVYDESSCSDLQGGWVMWE